MIMKKAQVTLFIIIAILVIAIIFLILWQQGIFGGKMASSDISEVKSYLNDCFKLKAQEGILFIAKQGGYNTLPEAHIDFLEEKTAYYWKDNQTLVPSVQTVEQELVSYLDAHASECLKMPGYALTATTCNVGVEIKNTTRATFICPVTIKKGSASAQLKDFNVEIDAPITKMIDVSAQIVAEYKKVPSYLCISCYDEIATTNNVTIKAVPITKDIFEPEHIWFLITDKNIKFDSNITWRFIADLK